ncbi:MAG: hybrid sensor histidine kinase/response regulator [Candidatus Kapaibacterium sp.]|nr:MAG: hybrid sensor histidine kinase/response regulator [Candidatus Kapabacteria bacterium]
MTLSSISQVIIIKNHHSRVRVRCTMAQKKHTILIIDDNPANLEAIGACLRLTQEQYTVITAPNGQEGCQKAIFAQPDLVIMDWIMPEMSGLEALTLLKGRTETQDIPVVMLTGLGSAKHVEYALNAGAADYLRTPIDKNELLARVRATLALQDSYKEIKHQREKLETQNHELLALNQEKNEFLGIAAHDLKNPLNNIADLARIIEQDTDSMTLAEIQDFAKLIRESSAKMFELVRNLLDVNAIERGGIHVQAQHFDLVPLVNAVIETYTQRAASKGITLHFDYEREEMFAFADEHLSEQVVENIISNAVKYSPHGKNVYVRIKDEGGRMQQESVADSDLSPHTSSFLRIEVADEGPGISAEDMKKLFGKFARLSAQPTGGEHSTGLGLSIVRKLAEAMHGKVWCESQIGCGATFIVELPTTPSSSAPPTETGIV